MGRGGGNGNVAAEEAVGGQRKGVRGLERMIESEPCGNMIITLTDLGFHGVLDLRVSPYFKYHALVFLQ